MQFFNDRGDLLKDEFRNDTYAFLIENVDSFRI